MKIKYLKKYEKYYMGNEFHLPLKEFGGFISAADKDDFAIKALEGHDRLFLSKGHALRSDMYLIFLPPERINDWKSFKSYCNRKTNKWFLKIIAKKVIFGFFLFLPVNAKERILVIPSLINRKEWSKNKNLTWEIK